MASSLISSLKLIFRAVIVVVGGVVFASGDTMIDSNLPTVNVGRFSGEAGTPPTPWHLIQLDSETPMTNYRIIHWDEVIAIEATANASMALLARPLEGINLDVTPVLCWRWRVDAPLKSADMTRKSGDDYAARVYVAFDLPDEALSWTTRLKLGLARRLYGSQVPDAAINYVWDNRYPVGTSMPNAYTERTRMWVLQSGIDNAGYWVEERRNVIVDAQKIFGKLDLKATLLAVASDTDNTGEHARAGFADLHFTRADRPCEFTSVDR